MAQSLPVVSPTQPTLYDVDAMEQFRKRFKLHPEAIRRMRYALFQMHEDHQQAFARLGSEPAAAALREFDTSPLQVTKQQESQQDGSAKLVFKTADGAQFETVVLRAKTSRTSVCVSSQVGCQAGCPFCATSRMGLRRNLTANEILEQVSVAGRIAKSTDRRLRNVVFMGMGEPLDNETELHAAIEKLRDLKWFGFPGHRLVVSTVGVPDAMRRLVDRFPELQFALSLHSARPELRNKLIPWSRKHSWEELHGALRYIAERQQKTPHTRPIMIEYLMLDGVNDSDADAEALIDYVQDLNVTLNMIPYNPIPNGPDWRPTPKERRIEFVRRLRDAGHFVTIRYSMGPDIQAACGQLVQQ